jgi:aldehyde:ferredoxin oxidoreductase
LYGAFGKLLIVDLSKMDIIEKELEQDLLTDYLGGRGIGSYLMTKMITPGVEPLSAQNVIIFSTGPATDSGLPKASGYGIFTKSPSTGLFAETYCTGSAIPLVKRTGYDAIIISGAAAKPSFITISELGVNFYDADEIWGLDSSKAEESILGAVGASGSESVVIGEAGEEKLTTAGLKSNFYGEIGHDGFGAVLGSKNLKGIVFRGNAKATVYDNAGLNIWNKTIVPTGNNHYRPATVTLQNQSSIAMHEEGVSVQDGLSFEQLCSESLQSPAGVLVDYEDRVNILNSLVVCHNDRSILHWEDLITLIFILTGKRYCVAELRAVSARIASTVRLFNLLEGVDGSKDLLPLGLMKESLVIKKELSKEKELELMLKDYYLLRGWDEKGIPPWGKKDQDISRRTIKCL